LYYIKARSTNVPTRRKIPVTKIKVESSEILTSTSEASEILTSSKAPETEKTRIDDSCVINVNPKILYVDSDYVDKKFEFYARVPSKISEEIIRNGKDIIIWKYFVGDQEKAVPLYKNNKNGPVYYDFIDSTIILTINLVNETYINNYRLMIYGSECKLNEKVSIKRNGKQL
jgi:hypothetical protein